VFEPIKLHLALDLRFSGNDSYRSYRFSDLAHAPSYKVTSRRLQVNKTLMYVLSNCGHVQS
jgi:hypothetical protein